MTPTKIEKKHKAKRLSSHKVLGIDSNSNNPPQQVHKTKNVENIGGGFNP